MQNFSNLTKAELVNQLTVQTQTTQEALNAANYFYSNIVEFDGKIAQLNPPKKLNLLWIWNNRKLIIQVIEFIVERIKEIKGKVEELRKNEAPKS